MCTLYLRPLRRVSATAADNCRLPVGQIWETCFYFSSSIDRLALLVTTSVFDLTHFLYRCATRFDDFTNIMLTGAVF